jgi:hypothetical protein
VPKKVQRLSSRSLPRLLQQQNNFRNLIYEQKIAVAEFMNNKKF